MEMTLMFDDTTGCSADVATHPADVAYLPGRTVTDGVTIGVVFEADTDGTVLVRWNDAGFTERCTAADLRAVHPDRPTLAHDELFAHELGRILARRAGREADYHGEATLQVGWRESARDALRELDRIAVKAKHAGCPYTYVVSPDGQRRPGPTDFEDGDRLVVCMFYVDGPGAFWCGPHTAAGDRGSIFQPTPADLPILDDCAAIRDVVALSPFETAGPLRVEVSA